jgi:hypothetical protein
MIFINFLKRLLALFLYFGCILLSVYFIYYSLTFKDVKPDWLYIIEMTLAPIILFVIAYKINITRVCPNCNKNRGIEISEAPIDASPWDTYESGDYKYRERNVRYEITRQCNNCNYVKVNYEDRNERQQVGLSTIGALRQYEREKEYRREARRRGY